MIHIDDERLYEYLDRQLDAAAQEQVNGHLAGCTACRARLREVKALFRTLESLPEAPLVVDLSRQVVARLSAEYGPRPLPGWTLPVIGLQLTAALVLFSWLWPMIGSAMETAGQVLPRTVGQILPEVSLAQFIDPIANSLILLAEFGRTFSLNPTITLFEGILIIGLGLILWLAGSSLLLMESVVLQHKR